MRTSAIILFVLLVITPATPVLASSQQLEQLLAHEQAPPVLEGVWRKCAILPETCGRPVPAFGDPSP